MVQTTNMHNGVEEESGIVSRAAMRRARTSVEKAAAWAVLALGWIGSISTAHGGWEQTIAHFSGAALLGGIVLQGVLTWLEWAYEDCWYIAWPARLIDALLTTRGYGFLCVSILTVGFSMTGLSTIPSTVAWWKMSAAGMSAWMVIYLVSLLIAWYPEHTLVRD